MKLSIIIPVYNEQSTLLESLGRVLDLDIPKEIIIVDDCSTDDTHKILETINEDEVRVVYRPENGGKGSALRTGIPLAQGEYTVFHDADLEYNPGEIPGLLDKAEQEGLDAVYGSRILGGDKTAYLHYYWGNRFLSVLTNVIYGTRLTDVLTCYKLIKTKILQDLALEALNFEIEFEITAHLAQRNHKFGEVPISYAPRSFEEGKKIRIMDGFIGIQTLLKNRFNRRTVRRNGVVAT